MSSQIPERELQAFEAAVAELLGLRFVERQVAVLEAALSNRLAALGTDPRTYLERVLFSGNRRELDALAPLLTVSETFFFRGREQLRTCLDEVGSHSTRLSDGGGPIRILSAGCATGEEAYSLAILAQDSYPDLAARLDVVGADINPQALERARIGEYGKWSLRDTRDATVERWFTGRGTQQRLDEVIRRRVRFVRCNLADPGDPLLSSHRFEAILCRNVLMYFTPEQFTNTVQRLIDALTPGGLLFLGHAETLRDFEYAVELRDAEGTFFHQKRMRPGESRLWSRTPAAAVVASRPAIDWVEQIEGATKRISALAAARGDESRPELRPLDCRYALELIETEQFSEFDTWLRSLSQAEREQPEVRLVEAAVLVHRGRLAEAEPCSAALMSWEYLRADAHYLLAICSAARGRDEAAADHDRAAAQLDPSFALPRLHLGRIELTRGNWRRARIELAEARALLEQEQDARIQLLAAGFARSSLIALCDSELQRTKVQGASIAPD